MVVVAQEAIWPWVAFLEGSEASCSISELHYLNLKTNKQKKKAQLHDYFTSSYFPAVELRLRDGEWPALGHTARKGQGWNVNPGMPGCSACPVMVAVGSGWKSLRKGSGGGLGAIPEQREDMGSGALRRQA